MMRTARQRVFVSAGVVALAAALAGLSTWASFTDSTTGVQSVSTGVVDIDVGATGTSANRLDVNATNLAPGDNAQRALDLLNSSTVDMSQVAITASAGPSSLLDTDTTNGLQLYIDRCSVPWTEGGSAPAYTYTCSGTTTTVLGSRPVIVTSQTVSNLVLTAGGGVNHLRVRLTLPTSADNTFQGLSSDLHFSFSGVQRAATQR